MGEFWIAQIRNAVGIRGEIWGLTLLEKIYCRQWAWIMMKNDDVDANDASNEPGTVLSPLQILP